MLKHLVYLFWHKFYVFRSGWKRGVPVWQLLVHDWSKFLPSEFVPYTNHFFVGRSEPSAPTYGAFRQAFKLHYQRNAHHWEHWYFDGFAHQMPDRYVKEMLADWDGAGLAKNGVMDTREYYTKNRWRIMLHPITRAQVDKEMGLV